MVNHRETPQFEVFLDPVRRVLDVSQARQLCRQLVEEYPTAPVIHSTLTGGVKLG
jgi:hypothetical protein